LAEAVLEPETERSDNMTRKLGEFCEFIIDCEHKTAPTQETGYPSIRTPNIGRGRFILEGVNRVSEETYRLWTKRAVPRPGDLIMAREAPVGNVARIPEGLQPCLGQRTLLIRPDKSKVDSCYLTYLLIGEEVQGIIHAMANGATVAHLNMKDVRELDLPQIPPLQVQRRIAGMLSAYDELIENSQRRIRILEEIARALYREWFILFRFPGHETVAFVASAVGNIPRGWELKPLESLMSDHIGGGWGKETPDDSHTEPAWVIRGTDIPDARSCRFADVPHRFHTASNLRSRYLRAGDIVFEVSGGSKGQLVGRTLLVTTEILSGFGGEAVICASFCKRVRPDSSDYCAELLYLSFLEGYESGEIEQFQVQSTGISNFKWTEYIAQTRRAVPPEPLRKRFRDCVSPLFSQISTLGLRTANLRWTRDLLLPRLLSGQVNLETD
jgi:type I restriction enzyme S subunit